MGRGLVRVESHGAGSQRQEALLILLKEYPKYPKVISIPNDELLYNKSVGHRVGGALSVG